MPAHWLKKPWNFGFCSDSTTIGKVVLDRPDDTVFVWKTFLWEKVGESGVNSYFYIIFIG